MNNKIIISIISLILFIMPSFIFQGNKLMQVSSENFQKITPQQARELISENKNNPNFIVIDFRTLNEFSTGHLQNAVCVDFNSDNFREDLDKLDKSKVYLIYCRSGYRSALALEMMQEMGFVKIYDLGGITDWVSAGYSVVQ